MRPRSRQHLRASFMGVVVAIALALSVLVPALIPAAANAAPAPFQQSSNGRYMIGLKANTGSPFSLAPGLGHEFGFTPFAIFGRLFDGFAANLSPAMAKALSRDARVAFVEPDFKVQAVATPIVNTGDSRIEAPENSGWVSDSSTGGPNNNLPGIAVLDSGIGPNDDLNIVGGVLCSQSTAVCGAGSYADNLSGEWHGTHVSGIAAGEGNPNSTSPIVGVAPGAPLWAVKVLDQNGSGYLSTIIAGLNWVAANAQADNIAVINMSFGCNCYSYSMNIATQNAANAGLVLVAAAGNSSQNTSNFYPASSPDVISVSAIADYDGQPGHLSSVPQVCISSGNGWNYQDDSLAGFSNYGATIAAPGVCILSTIPTGNIDSTTGTNMEYLSGTSMASPSVAGAAALYIATGQAGPANSSSRWSTVRSGLLNNWSTPKTSQCGYTNTKSSEKLLLIAPCGASVPTQPTTGTISGTVTDNVTSAAISGASISLSGPTSAIPVTTGSNGSYSFSNLAPGTYNVNASASNYSPNPSTDYNLNVTAGSTTTGSFSLTPNPGEVTVTVTDGTNPISNASVTLVKTQFGGTPTGPTVNNGAYSFTNVTEGTYALTVSLTGYQTVNQSITVGPGANLNSSVTLTPILGSISGTVVISGTSTPIAGAMVTVNGTNLSSSPTGSNGSFTIANVPQGSYTLTATAPGYQQGTSGTVNVTNNTATTGVTISLVANPVPQTGTVAGQVTVSFFGRNYAVSGASITVSMNGTNYTTTTNSNGSYSISVPAGNGSVSVSDSYGSSSQNVKVVGGQTSTVNFSQAYSWGGFF